MADPLSTAASIIAVIQLAVQVTKYLKDVKGGQSDRRRLRDEIRNTTTILEMLRDRIEEGDEDDDGKDWKVSAQKLGVPDGPLGQFKSTLEGMVAKLVPVTKMQKATQIWTWPFKQNDIKDLLASIERQKTLFMLALENDHFKLSQAIKKDLEEVAKSLDHVRIMQEDQQSRTLTKELSDILGWLSPLKFWEKQEDYISKQQVGTGAWLFETEEFKGWLAGNIKSVWCRGIAGAGKTILAASVIDHLMKTRASKDVAVLFVFCNYKEQTQQTVVNFMASLAEQLLRQLGTTLAEMPAELLELHQKHKGSHPNLVQLSKLLRDLGPLFREMFVVIDALDECEDVNGTRTDLLLEVSHIPELRLLCTSRDLSKVPDTLTNATHIEIRAREEDLRNFLQDRLIKRGRLSSLIKGDTELIDQISSKIIEKASGMFLLAELHVDSLSGLRSKREIRNALQVLPKEIYETYDKTMLRIRDQGEGDAELAGKVLYWVFFAGEPLQISTLQYFIAASETGPKDHFIEEDGLIDAALMVDVCAGMVTIDKKSGIIRLVHYTTQEYFQNHGAIKFPDAQSNITRTCLKIFALCENLRCSCSNHLSLRSVANVSKKSLQRFWKPYLYALQYWAAHVIKSPEDAVVDEILDFLDSSEPVRLANFCNSTIHPGAGLTFRCKGYQVKHFSSTDYPSHGDFDDDVDDDGLRDISTLWDISSPGHPYYNKAVPELWLAAKLGLRSLAERLLIYGTVADEATPDGTTALHTAAGTGNLELTELLLGNGANIEAKDISNETPLCRAARSGHHSTTLKLLEKGADVNFASYIGYAPLHYAVSAESPEVVETLLAHGADVHRENRTRETPMSLIEGKLANALRLDEERVKAVSKIISILSDYGADPKFRNYWPQGLVGLACDRDYPDIVKILLDYGEDIEQKGSLDPLLIQATYDWNSSKTLELLLERGADINARGYEEITALHNAIIYGNINAMKFLISKGASISARYKGMNVLQHVVFELGWLSNAADIIQLLLDSNAGASEIDDDGCTLLHIAIRGCCMTYEDGEGIPFILPIIKLLIENGVDISARNRDGKTAAQLALESEHSKIRKLGSSKLLAGQGGEADVELDALLQLNNK